MMARKKSALELSVDAGLISHAEARGLALAHAGHGGPGRGQGRKPTYPEPMSATIRLRATEAQKIAYARLGGDAWLRALLDSAG